MYSYTSEKEEWSLCYGEGKEQLHSEASSQNRELFIFYIIFTPKVSIRNKHFGLPSLESRRKELIVCAVQMLNAFTFP